MSPISLRQSEVTLIRAGAVRDARQVDARPGAVALSRGRVLMAGPTNEVERRLKNIHRTIERPNDLLMPALVNAHAHLELTGIGPAAFDGDFTAWLRQLIERRPIETDAIEAAVQRGIQMSIDAGVGVVGDIASSADAILARRRHPLPGVSYFECFGIGRGQDEAINQLDWALADMPYETPVAGHHRGVVLGISPHAPYTVGPTLYDHATKLSQNRAYRLCTHLAETPDELRFLRAADGPCREHLRMFDMWDETIRPARTDPVHFMLPYLKRARWLLAHCNYVSKRGIDILKRRGASVAYCPIASEYFNHPREDAGSPAAHPYRLMLDIGVNVCLGTDSIVCQPGDQTQPMGILPQMRRLYRRDGVDPGLLLKMATTNGMLALELNDADATLSRGAPARFCAVPFDTGNREDPLTQVLSVDAPAATVWEHDA